MSEEKNVAEQAVKGIERVLKQVTELTGQAYQVDHTDMANAWKKKANSVGITDEELFERAKYYYKEVTPIHTITYLQFIAATTTYSLEKAQAEAEAEIAGMRVGFANEL